MLDSLILNIMKLDRQQVWFCFEFTGPISLVIAYFLKTYQINEDVILLGILNLYGASLIGYSSYLKQNYPTILLEVFWGGISIGSFFKS